MDCSKTTNFFAELKRLCDLRLTCEAVAHDERCPLYDFCRLTHSQIYAGEAKRAIENLQKWSDEHPQKTYAQDFFEKFPKAPKNKSDEGWYPRACRERIHGGECQKIGCDECWNEPMEE